MARDLCVQYIGELSTLWKNEFKNLALTRDAITPYVSKEQGAQRLRRHRIMGLKLINFVHNLSRRTVLLLESRMDTVKHLKGAPTEETQGDEEKKDSDVISMRAGPRKTFDNRVSME